MFTMFPFSWNETQYTMLKGEREKRRWRRSHPNGIPSYCTCRCLNAFVWLVTVVSHSNYFYYLIVYEIFSSWLPKLGSKRSFIVCECRLFWSMGFGKPFVVALRVMTTVSLKCRRHFFLSFGPNHINIQMICDSLLWPSLFLFNLAFGGILTNIFEWNLWKTKLIGQHFQLQKFARNFPLDGQKIILNISLQFSHAEIRNRANSMRLNMKS